MTIRQPHDVVEMTYQFSDSFGLTGGYLAASGGSPAEDDGLFNGDYSALAQLTFTPGSRFAAALTYNHAYNNTTTDIFSLGGDSGIVGSRFANQPYNSVRGATVTNTYGAQASYQISDRVSLSAFGGYQDVRLLGRGDGETWFWGAGVALPDLGKEGNLGGIFVGQEPIYGGTLFDDGSSSGEPDTSLHVEAFYLYRVSDNISITPGVIWITAPNQDNDNDDAVIGTVRTTFTF